MFVAIRRSLASLLTATLLAGSVLAAGALDNVPADALGVAVVRNIAAANSKVEKLTSIFAKVSGSPTPPPLTLVKVATGLGDGIDEQGDVLLVVLPNEAKSEEPRLLFVVPVSDYAKFASSVSGDASGEICRVTIAGEEVLVAKHGEYALLMNVEHRPVLEGLLTASPAPHAALAKLDDWLGQRDAALVVLPAGVKAIKAAADAELATARAQMDQAVADPRLAAQLAEAKASMEMGEKLLAFCDAEVEMIGVGLAIDEALNVRLSTRVLFNQEGEIANFKPSAPTGESPLVGHAAGPFVASFGGVYPDGGSEWMVKFSRGLFEQFKETYGFQDFTEDDWKELDETNAALFDGLKSVSMLVRPGVEGDPIISNFFYVLKTEDASAYVKSARKSYELWNKLGERSTGDLKNVSYEFEDAKVGEYDAVVISTDFTALITDPNNPAITAVLKTMCGGDGKIRMHVMAVDKTTVLMGIAPEKSLLKAAEEAKTGAKGLAESAEVQTTTALFAKDASWQALVSPPGCVAWATRIYKAFMAQFGGVGGDPIPPYPASPPIGVSWRLADAKATVEVVWPAEAIKSLAAYIETVEKGDAKAK